MDKKRKTFRGTQSKIMSRRTRNALSFGYYPLPQRLIVILCVPKLPRFIDYIFALLISCLGFRSHPHRFGRAKCADGEIGHNYYFRFVSRFLRVFGILHGGWNARVVPFIFVPPSIF